ncbi:alkaline phosphatase family protein [Bacillus sp. FJAT-44742]|uniref:alkaline phosphatase family protein n=1 Tax=Bacillus sp. FJAT-44742 TaxID=2014005 RepID=UPI000C239998|nr:alkaline phosphatase family protein [Bacillus sp. FJAT-44742]
MRNVFLVFFVLLLCSCSGTEKEEYEPDIQANDTNPSKNVVMIIIDTMMGSSLDKSMEEGNVPALEFLVNKGQYYKDLVVPFPSMSVTVESTLVTGEMADKHRVPGLSWYDQQSDRVVNYGSTVPFWIRNGFSEGIFDVFYRLNNEHLSKDVSTVFEELERRGHTSGSINALIYRGGHRHELNMPPLTKELTDLPSSIYTSGPDILAFGQFEKPGILKRKQFSDGVFQRLGLHDKYTVEVTQELIKENIQPDFMLLFLPDNDKKNHKHGPHYRRGLEAAEGHLQDILNSYGSWEKALEENIFIVLGDHGADKLLPEKEEVAIDLDHLLSSFSIAKLGQPVSDGDIALGVNQRMTYVYDVHNQGILPEVIEASLEEEGIDLAVWEEDGWMKAFSPDHKGELRFKRGDVWKDRYNQGWEIEGNEEILTLDLEKEKKQVKYVDYPDVLNQLESALASHETPKVILAAKPGHSFLAEGITVHEDGGEHGGLHKNDLLAAMVIAGTEKEPASLRMVDLKEYVLDLFDNEETK